MKLGYVSAILPECDLPELLEFADEADYSCVEVMCWPAGKAERRYAGVTHLDVTKFTKSDAARVIGMTVDHDVEISGLGYYPNPLSPDAEESKTAVSHLRKVIKTAALLGINQVNTFVGRDWTKSVDDNWSRFCQVWKPLIKLAEKSGVRVAIENCPMLFSADEWPGGKNLATSPAIWRRMFEEIPSDYFGLNYDPSHLVWQQMDYIQPLWEFRDKIFHAHAKDVRIDRHRLDDVGILAHPLQYHTPKIPGLGEVDWGRFCSVLGDIGYRGPICVEVEDRAFEGSLEDRQYSLLQSSTYLRQFVPM